jgi:hypothetical protein
MGLGGAAVVIAGLVLCARSKLARMLCIQVAVGLSVLRIAFTFIVYVAGEPLPGVLGWVSAQFFFLNPGLLWMSFTLLGVSPETYRTWDSGRRAVRAAALEELALTTRQRSGILCAFKGDREIQLRDNEVTTHLFRIAQEAVHNSVKHGHPKRISIALTKPRGRITLAIRDDGSGMPVESKDRSGGLGMRIMQYRANAIGAQLSIETTAAGGTLVRCTLKREEDHAPASVR